MTARRNLITRLAGVAMAAVLLVTLVGGASALVPKWHDAPYENCLAELQSYLASSPEEPVDWLSVSHAIIRLGRIGNPECAPLVAQVLDRKAEIVLIPGGPLPGVMPPLDMIKAGAVDALKNLKATEYIPNLQELSESDCNRVLRLMALEAIDELR